MKRLLAVLVLAVLGVVLTSCDILGSLTVDLICSDDFGHDPATVYAGSYTSVAASARYGVVWDNTDRYYTYQWTVTRGSETLVSESSVINVLSFKPSTVGQYVVTVVASDSSNGKTGTDSLALNAVAGP